MISSREPSQRIDPTVAYLSRVDTLLSSLFGVSTAELISSIHAIIFNLIVCAIISFRRFNRPLVYRNLLF